MIFISNIHSFHLMNEVEN